MDDEKVKKLVSVIIPTHKRPKMLIRAVKSVLNQTYQNIEIIIVDDGSNDSTEKIVFDLVKKYRNIKYIKNEKPMGACFARNRGIKIAKGEFITGLDDDDEFLPNRIEKFIENYDDKFSFLCSNFYIKSQDKLNIIKSKSIITFNDLLWANIVGPQIFIRKVKLLEVGGFNESLPSAQDYDLWLRLIKKYGSAKRIQYALYILHTEHDLPRISTSINKIKGYRKVYLSFKKNMTIKQRIYNIIILNEIRNKNTYLYWKLLLFPSYYFFHYIYMQMIDSFSFIEQLKQKINLKLDKQ